MQPLPSGRPVPVLLYHAVTTTPGDHIAPFTVSPSAFADQLDALVAAGYRCLTVNEWRSSASASLARERVALITFDDGYADFASAALPALQARSLPCTLYLTTGWLRGRGRTEPGPSDRMLDWSQVAEIAAAGVEVGAHSHRHPHLDTLGRAALLDELERPKAMLEDALGTAVPSVAYPHGYNGPRVRRTAQRVGYTTGAAVRDAFSHPSDDPFRLARLMLRADTSPDAFAQWLGQRGAPVADRGERLRAKGWRAYRRGRALVTRSPGSVYS